MISIYAKEEGFMEYLAVAFRSRTHTVKFAEYLNQVGISNEIINTPKEAGVGCGLSVKVSITKSQTIKRAISFVTLNSYAGTFLVKVGKDGRSVRSVF